MQTTHTIKTMDRFVTVPQAARDKWSDINKIRKRSLLCFTVPFLNLPSPLGGQVASCKISF